MNGTKTNHSPCRSFLGIIFCKLTLGGGGGNIPNFPNIHETRSDGCAPTDSQYRNLSVFNLISFIPSLVAIGLYVPTYNFKFKRGMTNTNEC